MKGIPAHLYIPVQLLAEGVPVPGSGRVMSHAVPVEMGVVHPGLFPGVTEQDWDTAMSTECCVPVTTHRAHV